MGLTCRPVAAQFVTGDVNPMFELALDGEDVKLVEEKHYKLVLSDQIGAEGLFNKTCAALLRAGSRWH